jgi:hypothetical protein
MSFVVRSFDELSAWTIDLGASIPALPGAAAQISKKLE